MSSLSLICTILCAALSLTQATGFGGRPANAVGEYIAQTGFYQSLSLTDEKPIIEMRSEFQDISVMRSEYYGKILMLDGVIQLTERDANSYNEMMTHPAMFSHPNPRRVLVIGGGDGYVLSEVLKHPEVEHVDHVDLDGAVVQVCKAHFVWGNAWDDPRVSLHIADGAEFIKNATAGSYDVIIQDSSDPFTWDEETGEKIELPSKSLYTDEHFENISMALGDKGVFSFQAEVSTIWCW
jgi:spermidine synthase